MQGAYSSGSSLSGAMKSAHEPPLASIATRSIHQQMTLASTFAWTGLVVLYVSAGVRRVRVSQRSVPTVALQSASGLPSGHADTAVERQGIAVTNSTDCLDKWLPSPQPRSWLP